ncbi:unnamed protein product [Paramecium sonneborni]|uniref:Uncharacterized protein n=1 Tax=Paramecium sonneborni TaxID=65129 RepID=A0A8S1QGZ1_9CILI|nr:unnamed protein product [Paramecium sonneborni]
MGICQSRRIPIIGNIEIRNSSEINDLQRNNIGQENQDKNVQSGTIAQSKSSSQNSMEKQDANIEQNNKSVKEQEQEYTNQEFQRVSDISYNLNHIYSSEPLRNELNNRKDLPNLPLESNQNSKNKPESVTDTKKIFLQSNVRVLTQEEKNKQH